MSMNSRSKPGRSPVLAAILAASLAAGCGGKNDALTQAARTQADRPSIAEAKAIAEEGFVYGLPIVMNYAAVHDLFLDPASSQYKAPIGQIHNEARVFTPEDTAIVTPNSDTPYSMLQMDLRTEPAVLSVPAVEKGRYYSVMLCDANTYNFGYIGSRATGTEPGDYLVAGPGWNGETPAGVRKVFRATTQFATAVYRTQLFDGSDIENVKKVQAGYRAQPLSAYLKTPAPPAPPAVAVPKIDKELVKTEFFEYLDFALQFAPERPEEKEIRGKLARIGVGPGKTFSWKDLSLEHNAEILLGMKEGSRKVDEKVAAIGKEVNGWRIASSFGDAEFYKGDWLLRAAAARAGIYGNDADEAMYPMTRALADGEPLDGSKSAYTLTFAKGQYPPVNSFWSVTMYEGKSQLLVENPIQRYLINSPMLPKMKKGADGSLTIYIQKDSPGKDKESNWLPAPDGPIYLVMRLYWPRTDAPSILPPGEGSWQPPALKKVS
jgi:hypothetical protein